ncbi:hypothetical protein [Limosilactobacillus sp.]|uniref:hypothetical protein n=1 Tax=Limosilactobacillus sp. TaxID=2773925 RepID=UPI003F009098
MTNEDRFRQALIRFYQACQLSSPTIEQIMEENDELISCYLAATPELVARKLYQQTLSRPL